MRLRTSVILTAALWAGHAAAAVVPDVTLPEASAAPESGLIYGNFGAPPVLFDINAGHGIDASGGMAMPFRPTLTAQIKRVRTALAIDFGQNVLKIALHADNGGVPGTVIKSFKVTGMPYVGECCVTADAGFAHATVQAGRTYWLVVSVPKGLEIFAAWYLNNTGAVGSVASQVGGTWTTRSARLGAFEVQAR
jgi:hypothetical protein